MTVSTENLWMLYGAYGTTGRHILHQVMRRGLLEQPIGAMTPAQAFGADFGLSLPETTIQDL